MEKIKNELLEFLNENYTKKRHVYDQLLFKSEDIERVRDRTIPTIMKTVIGIGFPPLIFYWIYKHFSRLGNVFKKDNVISSDVIFGFRFLYFIEKNNKIYFKEWDYIGVKEMQDAINFNKYEITKEYVWNGSERYDITCNLIADKKGISEATSVLISQHNRHIKKGAIAMSITVTKEEWAFIQKLQKRIVIE